jgi:hypothetical protein
MFMAKPLILLKTTVTHKAPSPSHCVFLVAPATVKDNGGRRLARQDFFVELLTPEVATKTFELAENRIHGRVTVLYLLGRMSKG